MNTDLEPRMTRWAVTMQDGTVIELSAHTQAGALQRAARVHRGPAERAQTLSDWQADEASKFEAELAVIGAQVIGYAG